LLDVNRHVLLANSQVERVLAKYFVGEPRKAGYVPNSLEDWITQQELLLTEETPFTARAPLVLNRGTSRIVVRLYSSAHQNLLLFEEKDSADCSTSVPELGLTQREAEVLAWVARGKTNFEIGTILGTSPLTVKKHLERIFQKLGVENRTAAASCVFGAAA
jgi:DNA-binding CsgD family transcriptional regulator